jgi:hypothetical protein
MKVKCRLIFLLHHTSGSGMEWIYVDLGMEAALPLRRLGVSRTCTINSVTQFDSSSHSLAIDLHPKATLEESPRIPHPQSIRLLLRYVFKRCSHPCRPVK